MFLVEIKRIFSCITVIWTSNSCRWSWRGMIVMLLVKQLRLVAIFQACDWGEYQDCEPGARGAPAQEWRGWTALWSGRVATCGAPLMDYFCGPVRTVTGIQCSIKPVTSDSDQWPTATRIFAAKDVYTVMFDPVNYCIYMIHEKRHSCRDW